MNQLIDAAKAVIEVWDAGRGVWDQISALRAAVDRAESQEPVGFDEYWRKEKFRWDKNLQRDVKVLWTVAQQAERQRIKEIINYQFGELVSDLSEVMEMIDE